MSKLTNKPMKFPGLDEISVREFGLVKSCLMALGVWLFIFVLFFGQDYLEAALQDPNRIVNRSGHPVMHVHEVSREEMQPARERELVAA